MASNEEFLEKIKTLQVPRKPHVDQKTAGGSTQTYHTTGRVDANVVIDQPIKASMKINDDGGDK